MTEMRLEPRSRGGDKKREGRERRKRKGRRKRKKKRKEKNKVLNSVSEFMLLKKIYYLGNQPPIENPL